MWAGRARVVFMPEFFGRPEAHARTLIQHEAFYIPPKASSQWRGRPERAGSFGTGCGRTDML